MSTPRRRVDLRRKNRPRPTPKWLKASGDLDPIARSRCLMVLSVLSGEKPVSDAISEVGISRGTYYQLETRALSAMLRALAANAVEETEEASPQRQVAKLERKVKLLEQGKRRAERLLLMTRRVMGPVKTRSTTSGHGPLRNSRKRRKSQAAKPLLSPSTPAPTGVAAP
jgi:hypothetical protein